MFRAIMYVTTTTIPHTSSHRGRDRAGAVIPFTLYMKLRPTATATDGTTMILSTLKRTASAT